MIIVKFAYYLLTAFISLVLVPFFLPFPRGRSRLWERFGIWGLSGSDYIWVHAASFGEVNGVIPILHELKRCYPQNPILLTATSVTGLDRAKGIVAETRLLPFDSALWYWLALRSSRIRLCIIAETEIWPAFLMALSSRQIPVFLVNGIVTDYSYSTYFSLRVLVGHLLAVFKLVCVVNERMRERFVKLGLPESKVIVTGNSKYDVAQRVTSVNDAKKLKEQFFAQPNPTLILGSLRPGEEVFWFSNLSEVIENGAVINVLIAPRHAEKFEYFASALKGAGIKFDRWSDRRINRPPGAEASGAGVLLLDTLGDLADCYSFADLAFVGGSMVDWGGHNPLEPAAYGACVAVGPYSKNVKDIVEQMAEQGALVPIETAQDVKRLLARFLSQPEEIKLIGLAGREVSHQHAGATKAILEAINVSVG